MISDKCNKLKLNLLDSKILFIISLIINLFCPSFAFANKGSEWVTATVQLTEAIKSMSPQVFTLGLVFLLASGGIWLWFPKARHATAWVWGTLGLIIVVYFIGSYYGEPLKNTFSSVLDPIKWISPSG
ncbi:hypothetical protein [Fluviispira sanaruensis]|uniref:TrbC/VirB2 family protein n=1 Tax=Fluviispira sanaruensis TaxID=2493639 RepID=A0A4P2VMS3_FLUSA|nr:hypothetical protein [Fluviispira sanaruensis]BBH54713.1 hypothetical protein JCM31447_31870 [Fluviispira sanaruensis]